MKRQKSASLTDVARQAGVDASTVSRVLNGDAGHRVRQETRDRIVAAARGLGYRPNIIAKGLRTSRTFTLGVIVPQLDNPVFPQIIEGAEIGARDRGYTLLISHLGEGVRDNTLFERLAWMNHVDGLLVAALDVDETVTAVLDRTGSPYVILNQSAPHVGNYVVLDSLAAAKLAVSHLIGIGHQRIGHIGGRHGGYNSIGRLAGYRAALAQAHIPYDASLVAWGGFTQAGGRRALDEMFDVADSPPTAVFAATILSAAGAMTGLRERGLDIPEDVSVVAIHDSALAEALYPPLTTVRMPLDKMGYDAASGLIDIIEGKLRSLTLTLPPTSLVQRGSTMPRR